MTYRPEDLPREVRELVELAGDQERARELAQAIARKRRKTERDREADARARVLVGARLPREEAQAIQREAEHRGQSVYRFIREVLYQEAHW